VHWTSNGELVAAAVTQATRKRALGSNVVLVLWMWSVPGLFALLGLNSWSMAPAALTPGGRTGTCCACTGRLGLHALAILYVMPACIVAEVASGVYHSPIQGLEAPRRHTLHCCDRPLHAVVLGQQQCHVVHSFNLVHCPCNVIHLVLSLAVATCTACHQHLDLVALQHG
jgi:hypothetical protein